MSVSFCVVFESDVPPYGTLGADHLALVNRQRMLERLALENGLASLGSFESYDPADAEGLLDEEEVMEQPAVQWFSPTAALVTVRGLIACFRVRPDLMSRQPELLADLVGIEAELADGEKAGVRFRFAIVP